MKLTVQDIDINGDGITIAFTDDLGNPFVRTFADPSEIPSVDLSKHGIGATYDVSLTPSAQPAAPAAPVGTVAATGDPAAPAAAETAPAATGG